MTPIQIRIGNQTNCDVPARRPFEFALRHGFDAFEWFSDKARAGWCEDAMPAAERAELRQVAAAHGLRFSVHAPFAADPTTPAGSQAIRRSIAFGADVAAGVINLHIFPAHPVADTVTALGPLLEAARLADVCLSLENTPQTSPEHCNALFAALAALPQAVGRLGLCLDSGHAALFPGTHNDAAAFVARLEQHVPIVHWHAHENWGDQDSHLPLFTGPSARDDRDLTELVGRLKARGFTGSVVLEQWPQPPEILIATRTRLLRLWALA